MHNRAETECRDRGEGTRGRWRERENEITQVREKLDWLVSEGVSEGGGGKVENQKRKYKE